MAVVAYAVLGGADFGSGIWDLLAGTARRGAPTSFALRKYAPTLRAARLAGATFAVSSLITPLFLGSIAGAVASGRVAPNGETLGLSTALSSTSLVGGILAVLTCTFLAGVFLAAEAARLAQADLADRIRRRSLWLGLTTGGLALAGIILLRRDAPTLSDALAGRASPLILVDHVTIDNGAGHPATLTGLLIASAIAAVLVVPPLVFLFWLANTNRVGSTPEPKITDC